MFQPKVMVGSWSFVCSRFGHRFVKQLDFDLPQCSIRLFGEGGRTVQKIKQHDWQTIQHYSPDIILLEIGANDLSILPPETVGSQIDDLVSEILRVQAAQIIGVAKITRQQSLVFNNSAAILNQYLEVVLGEKESVFVWAHRGLLDPQNQKLLPDGVHLNNHGQYKLYRSYRGAIIHALKLLNDAA